MRRFFILGLFVPLLGLVPANAIAVGMPVDADMLLAKTITLHHRGSLAKSLQDLQNTINTAEALVSDKKKDSRKPGVRDGWRWDRARFRGLDPPKSSYDWRELHLTLERAVELWPPPGGYAAAACVIDHESGWNPYNRNPYSSASGIYQFISSTWSSALGAFRDLHPHWKIADSVFNARSNLLVGTSYAHLHGWSAWSTRGLCGV